VGCCSLPLPTDTLSPSAWEWAAVRRRRRPTRRRRRQGGWAAVRRRRRPTRRRRRHEGGLLFAAAADRHAIAVGMGVGCYSLLPPT